MAVTAVGGLLLMNQQGLFFPASTQSTGTRTAATQAAPHSPTFTLPTETAVPATLIPPTLSSTDLPPEATIPAQAGTSSAPTLIPTSLPVVETPTAEPPTAAPVATVKYPNGKRFRLFYDDNSLYLLNLSESVVSIYSVAFERLSTTDVPLNRFDGWRWAEFYPNSKPDWCMAIEILSSPSYLRPPECAKGYLSTRTPTRDDPVMFWTSQEGSHQFRVLWRASGQQEWEEVARCEIGAGTCEVFFP
jgi:hypothetical protein